MIKAPRDKRAARQTWATPAAFVGGIARITERPIDIDVCAEAWSAKAPVWIGPGSSYGTDGLAEPWSADTAWCNPPYETIGPWVEKALSETRNGDGVLTWLLVPPRTDRPWWHQLCRASCTYLVFLEGRIEFVPPPGIDPSTPMGGVVLWQVGGAEPLLPLSLGVAQVLRAGRM